MRPLLTPSLLLGLSLVLLARRADWLAWLPRGVARLESDLLVGAQILVWVATTWLAARVAVLTLRLRIRRRSGREAPNLLIDLVIVGVWIAGLCGMSIVVLGVSPGAAVTTSGLLVAIVGFAIRHMIADLFYGLTLALERPFEIGDWIQIPDGSTGRVTQFTWRAVKFVTRDNLKVIVPNSELATSQLVNYDQPDPSWRSSLRITLGYDVDTRRAERLLAAAVEQVPEVAALPRPTEARIVEYRLEGVVWELRFWIPDYAGSSAVTQRVHRAVLRNLHVAGLGPPRKREEVLLGGLQEELRAEREAARSWIDRIELFAVLDPAERSGLRERARRIEIPAGGQVVRQGEPGSSLFVLAEGVLGVWLGSPGDGAPASKLHPGDFFGEMSLLTGEPRSASVLAAVESVVYEIGHADLGPILERHPALPHQLAQVLEARSRADAEREATASQDAAETDRSSRVARLLERIRSWFQLSETPEPRRRLAARAAPPTQLGS